MYPKIRRISFTLICMLLSIKGMMAQLNGPAKYVILVSIDGFRPDFYNQDKWPAPNLKWLAGHGIRADGLRPVVPSMTLPNHVTMVTGALPFHHGVYHNKPFDPKAFRTARYDEVSQIKVPTLWEEVNAAGGKTAAIAWPVSGNADFIDYNYGYTRVKDQEVEGDLNAEIEKYVTGVQEPYSKDRKYPDYAYFKSDLQRADVAGYLIKNEKYRPNFMSIHFSATDHFQHEQGRNGEKVDRAIAIADVCVGQLMEAAKAAGTFDQTAFIIVGDHGFENRHTQLAWNSVLIKEGLLSISDDSIEWKAFFKDQLLILKDKGDKKTLAKVRDLLENQPPAIRKLYRIAEREELDRYGADPDAVLAVQTVEGVVCTTRYDYDQLVQFTQGGSHGPIPDDDHKNLYAGFIAFGPGLRKNMTVPKLRMEDLAPHIAFLLGLDFKAVDGLMYPGVISEELIKGY